MTTRPRWLRSLAVATAATFLSWPALIAAAETPSSFTIRDVRVTESSGLARDTGSKVYWTVNRSSVQGTAYGVSADGNVKGIIGFRAKPKDVEAVAVLGSRLYVADIGDRTASRKFVTVYFLNGAKPDNVTVPYRSYDFSYPDGPHDAATLLVNRGRLYLVTKGARGGIYMAPKVPSRQGVNQLKRVGDAPAFVTDGVFLPGGKQIALRTYVSVEVLDASTYRVVARAATPYQPQGESITSTLDGKALLIGSLGQRSSVLNVAIPTKLGTVPTAAATPPPSPTATPSASASASDPGDTQDDSTDDEQAAPASRGGTILALSLAALVAVVAGVVVAARKS